MAQSLEDGGLSLNDATVRFAEGMDLVRRCNQLLDEAELKITTLKDGIVGAPEEETWLPED